MKKTHKTTILTAVSYGYGKWSVNFKERCKIQVYENKVLRTIRGRERDEISEKFRILHK
jgi:predicted nucleotide-binding protein (sugar kinase/HSP70/actin superfamily)